MVYVGLKTYRVFPFMKNCFGQYIVKLNTRGKT
nr:MAG TPA: protein of unknown function (DUF1894) [Caudoviricetes sp.]